MKTINERWHEYREKVLPKNAGEVQVTETKRAFFAGWVSALNALRQEVAELSEDEGVEQLQKFEKECAGYVIAIAMGKA